MSEENTNTAEKKKMSKLKKFLLIFLGFVFISGIILYATSSWWMTYLAERLIEADELAKADAIVILGGEPTERLEYGVSLYKDGWAPKIILSGGEIVYNITYASGMKTHAIDLGVPEADIILQDKSQSTFEDSKFCNRILRELNYNKIILVTSPYHSGRAKYIFSEMLGENFTVISSPVPDSWFKADKWWETRKGKVHMAREYLKRLWIVLGMDDFEEK